MGMMPFFQQFPETAARDTRSATFTAHASIPDGEYAFLEFYCDEANCDCRRVIIRTIRRGYPGRIWATLTYGWEDVEFYQKWSKYCGDHAIEMAGVQLEQLSPQSAYSNGFKEFFKSMVATDAEYLDRLKRHYAMMKGQGPRVNESGPTIAQWRVMNRARACAEKRRNRR